MEISSLSYFHIWSIDKANVFIKILTICVRLCAREFLSPSPPPPTHKRSILNVH